MAKTGRPKKKYGPNKTVGIRVDQETRYLMDKYGDTEYWRDILKVIAETKQELDRGVIDPADFAYIAGARTAQVTGIPAKDESDSEDGEE